MSTVRTAIIGCGKVGQIHGEAHTELPESELVAVCDAGRERAKAFSQRYGGHPYTDVATMIQDAGVQAVSICTPHPLHTEPAILAKLGCAQRTYPRFSA